ncbi:MAG TPA: thioredoxin domain-containing protein [Acidobacteriaceae bacterium]|nr:thioredoxin domain-containing protein [Acidobacteriaceae bacterium]
MRLPGFSRLLVAALFASLSPAGVSRAAAQTSVPPNQVDHFTDTSMLKPPTGAKVAIVEWEDLECPACAHAFPFVHQAVSHYKIPLVRYDFLIPGHMWSHQAALYARYMQDKIAPDFAEDYRRQVFSSQYRIASQDDLVNFTKQYMSSHGKQLPFVVDPSGQLEREVQAEVNLGKKLNLQYTPTIVVVTPTRWIQVKDVSELYSAIDQAMASTGAPAKTAAAPAHRTATAHK